MCRKSMSSKNVKQARARVRTQKQDEFPHMDFLLWFSLHKNLFKSFNAEQRPQQWNKTYIKILGTCPLSLSLHHRNEIVQYMLTKKQVGVLIFFLSGIFQWFSCGQSTHFRPIQNPFNSTQNKDEKKLTRAFRMPRTVIPTIGATCTLTPGSMYSRPVRSMCKSFCNVYGLSAWRSHFSPTIDPPVNSVNEFFVCVWLPLSISFWMVLSHLANTEQHNSNANCTWQPAVPPPPPPLINVRRMDFFRDLFIAFISVLFRFINFQIFFSPLFLVSVIPLSQWNCQRFSCKFESF